MTIFVRNMAVTQAMFDRLLRWNCSTVASPFQGRNLQKVSFSFSNLLSIFPSRCLRCSSECVHSLGSWVLKVPGSSRFKQVQVWVRQGSFLLGSRSRDGSGIGAEGYDGYEVLEGGKGFVGSVCYEAREVLKGTRWGYHPSLF